MSKEIAALPMPSVTLVPVTEYLNTSYRPDREFVDGILIERNVGEWDHCKLQAALIIFLTELDTAESFHVIPEQRVQVGPHRFRVPDLCVVLGEEPGEQIITAPPFLCIEILARDDRMSEMQERIDDYLRFGVTHVWLLDPRTKRAFSYQPSGVAEPEHSELRTTNPPLAVPLDALFSA